MVRTWWSVLEWPGLSGDYNVSGNRVIAFTYATSKRPTNIAIMQKDQMQQLTHLNEDFLSHKNLGETHELV